MGDQVLGQPERVRELAVANFAQQEEKEDLAPVGIGEEPDQPCRVRSQVEVGGKSPRVVPCEKGGVGLVVTTLTSRPRARPAYARYINSR